MSFPSGFLKDRITILNRCKSIMGCEFGVDSSLVEWKNDGSVSANVTFAKGLRALNAGAMDAYCIKLVRMRWNNVVTLRSRIEFDGGIYQILPETFNADRTANEIQFSMQLVNA